MKIGPKIALFYSLITMCAIIMVMSVFYLFSSRYINRLYESYLREKHLSLLRNIGKKMKLTNRAIG